MDIPVAAKRGKRCCFIFDHFGTQLNYFKQCSRLELNKLVKQVYEVDYKSGLMTLLANGFEMPKYITDTNRPIIDIRGIMHPALAPHAVPNDLPKLQNTIITGPNAGGKSTLLKAVLTNILLAQTVGVVSAKQFVLTPFEFISSQISIPDCKGKESLFQAEMYRCKEKLDIVRSLPKNAFMFIAMDEIFNSTNPLEGISGAFAVLKKLAEYSNTLVMTTTHFIYLTMLKDHGYSCKKMNVIQDPGKPIQFPYKLRNGVSRQAVALELLAANGFDEDLIQTAIEVKARLSTPRVQKPLKEI
jgi:DNA mismatch repair protein MutS